MRFIPLIIVALLSPAILGTAAQGADPVAAAKPEVIRFAFSSAGIGQGRQITAGSSLATAQIKGLLEDEFRPDGIRIEWTFNRGAGPAVNEGFANRQTDFATLGDFPAIVGRAAGLKTRILLGTVIRYNTYVAVPVNSPVTRLEDLKGKRIAYHKGTNLQLPIRRILRAHGLTDRDFREVNLDGNSGLTAMTSGDLDALWGGLELFILQERGLVKLIYSTQGQDPALTRQTAVIVSEEFEQRHPALVQRVVNVLVREAAWESDPANTKALYDLWAPAGVPQSVFAKEIGDDLKLRSSPLLDPWFREQYRIAAAEALDGRFIRKAVTVDDWFAPQYVERALTELHLERFWTTFDVQGKALPIH